MAPFGKNVPADVQKLATDKQQEISDGTFDPFQGPISDNRGPGARRQGRDHDRHGQTGVRLVGRRCKRDSPQVTRGATIQVLVREDSLTSPFYVCRVCATAQRQGVVFLTQQTPPAVKMKGITKRVSGCRREQVRRPGSASRRDPRAIG